MLFSPRPSLVGRLRTLTFAGALTAILALHLAAPGVARADQGYATWYGAPFQGNVMANGQLYNMYDPTTTACNIYPMGTWIKVTNPANGQSVVVQVRDTGAFAHALDLSYAAFKLIGDPNLMEIPVQYQVVSGPSGAPMATPTPEPTRVTPSTRGGRPEPTATNPSTYLVQPGDTLDSIADRFKLDPTNLSQWNQLGDPDNITAGTTLRLTAPAAQPTSATPAPAQSSSYVVKAGDTLSGIAVTYGIDLGQLAAANNLTDPYPIVVGQTLTIPVSKSSTKNAALAVSYIVQAGDTLDGIAVKFGVSPDRIAAANGLSDPDLIQPGTTLTIPAA